MVTVETNHVPAARITKKRLARRGPRQTQQRLSTLKELTAAILSYSNSRVGEVEQGLLIVCMNACCVFVTFTMFMQVKRFLCLCIKT